MIACTQAAFLRINGMPQGVSKLPAASNSSFPASDSAALDRFASAVLRVQTVAQHTVVRPPPATTFEDPCSGNSEESQLASLSAPSAAEPIEVKASIASDTAIAEVPDGQADASDGVWTLP